MSRTLILNISASAQTLPATYGSASVAVGFGYVVDAEASTVVSALGGFEAMDGIWVAYPVSTDTATGSIDVAANGVAMLATFVPSGGPGGGPVAWSDITGKPSFAPVATSGAYSDLSGKPALSTVAESGLYADLSGTPDIPSAANATPAAVSSVGGAGVATVWSRGDHQHAHGNLNGGSLHSSATTASAGFMSAADKSKLDGLATVATSGAYADLSGTPALAPVATSGAYADLSGTPTLAPVATSGSYADLTGTPTLSTVAASGSYEDLTATPSLAPVATTGAYADLTGKPSLAAVATSGAYSDLSGKPTLATVATSGSYADLSNKPSKTYDLMCSARGSLTVGTTVMECLMPRAATFSALTQGGGATVKVQVDGADITYPKSVSSGQVVSFVVTGAGTNNYATLAGVEA